MDIRGYYYDEILNLWYCHYLLDVENGMPGLLTDVLVQSNVDGEFFDLDNWDEVKKISMNGIGKDEVFISPVAGDDSPEGAAMMIRPNLFVRHRRHRYLRERLRCHQTSF